jgi:predicted ATP-binding protein involved in virulence
MKIKKIHIKNFRGIEDQTLELLDDVNVLVGVNGVGKSTILDAIAIPLSWLVNRIQRENASGMRISDSDIKMDADYSSIQFFVEEKNQEFTWTLVKSAQGVSVNEKSDLIGVSELARHFQHSLSSKSVLPVIIYYPINRVVNSVSPEISGRESMNILDVYENALGGKTNYQSFFEWFRLQDDIRNESEESRQKWITKNKPWVKERTQSLVTAIENIVVEAGANQSEFHLLRNRVFFLHRSDLMNEDLNYTFALLRRLLRFSDVTNSAVDRIFDEIEDLIYKMEFLVEERKGNLIDSMLVSVRRITVQLEDFYFKKNTEPMKKFVWDALSFAVLLNLWWLSDKGKQQVEAVFKTLETTKHDDDVERHVISDGLINSIKNILTNDAETTTCALKNAGRELKYVADAIENFIPNYTHLRVKRLPRPHMLVEKDGVTINLDQLSDGEKNLIALVGDIARRLAIANQGNDNPLEGSGIILIDEIDLHLHPSWQRIIIPKLTELFPNCQFIFSTHSPQVLSHVKPEKIFLLSNENNTFSYSKAIESYGKNTDRILEDLLHVNARPEDIGSKLHHLFKLIQEGELVEAKEALEELSSEIGEDSELVKAKILLKRREVIGK